MTPRQLSFKHAVQIWIPWYQHGFASLQESIIQLMALIACREVGNRPGRAEPRAVKRRPKPMSLLTKKWLEARQDILKNGHQRKLKLVPFGAESLL